MYLLMLAWPNRGLASQARSYDSNYPPTLKFARLGYWSRDPILAPFVVYCGIWKYQTWDLENFTILTGFKGFQFLSFF